MFRYLLCFFVLPFFCSAHNWQGSELDYAGLTVYCTQGCGDEADQDMKKIWRLTKETVNQSFETKDFLFVDHYGYEHWIVPWMKQDYDYAVFNCRNSNGEWVNGKWREPKRLDYSIWSHQAFEELMTRLQQDIHFYYLEHPEILKDHYEIVLDKLREGRKEGYACVTISGHDFDFGYKSFGECSGSEIRNLINLTKKDIQYIEEKRLERAEACSKAIALTSTAAREIDTLYKQMFTYCLQHHQEEGIKFKTTLESLFIGDYETAFEQICFLIDLAESKKLKNDLLSKLYLLKGQVQSEFALYADAIVSLTSSIQKNPQEKDSYFERATAYFELGEFDKAIEDYLISGPPPKTAIQWQASAKMSAGMIAGILDGGIGSLATFIPESLGTLHGLSKALWAFAAHPIDASTSFATIALECFKYIRESSTLEILEAMVPELKELIQKYDQLEDFEKGALIGKAIGRYGVDILACKYSAKAAKAFIHLKKANQTLTLEALISPMTSQQILAESAKCWTHREAVLKNGNITIDWGKQGKHIVGHNSYIPSDNKSIWIHSREKTAQLISEYAGTGMKAHGSNTHIPGVAGYHEIINFGENIGYYVERSTGIKTPTTWGKIHYANDGVHVVPYLPKGQ